MSALTLYFHVGVLVVITLMILLKSLPTDNWGVFLSYVCVLMAQVFVVYYNPTYFELFAEGQKDTVVVKALDVESLRKLVRIPLESGKKVTEGIDAVIETTSGKGDFASLYESTPRYKEEDVRKKYKHIDYMLEKTRLFDKEIYDKIVPVYSKETYDANQAEDEKPE